MSDGGASPLGTAADRLVTFLGRHRRRVLGRLGDHLVGLLIAGASASGIVSEL
ncbi:MAG: hypothetical protein JO116_07285 [Planctomycetaceae bacterium]|nr:hypothetical protein [Planctomycetaceae bacterium]MBV8555350.1 hypothetical protein [Planctomycetaceae bacterium]